MPIHETLMTLESLDYKLILLVIFFVFVNFRIAWLTQKLRSWELLILGTSLVLLMVGNVTSKNEFLNLKTHVSETLTIIFIVLAFSPEILGILNLLLSRIFPKKIGTTKDTIKEILSGAQILSSTKTGALIAFEASDDLTKLAQSGTVVNSDVKKELLTALFSKDALTHDGGTVIRNGRIAYCSVIFPITFSLTIDKNLGTRHRAAIGLTESTDAICLIVSEEEGTISLARDGKIYYNLNQETLEKYLSGWLFKKSRKIGYLAHRLRDVTLREQSQAALRFLPSPLSAIYNFIFLLFWISMTLNLIMVGKGALAKETILSYLTPQLLSSEIWKWLPLVQIAIRTILIVVKREYHFEQDAQVMTKELCVSWLPIWKTKRSFGDIKRILVKREGKQSVLWSLLVEDKDGKRINVDASGSPNGLLEDAKKVQNFLKIELVNQS